MKTIVYTKDNCPACVQLKTKLTSEGVDFVEVHLGKDMTIEAFKEQFPTVRSVPHMVDVKDAVW
jgi:glutaredoxin